ITAKNTTKALKSTLGNSSWEALAIAPKSAPKFKVLAAKSRIVQRYKTQRGKNIRIFPASPRPVTKPILAHISWIKDIKGKVNGASQSSWKPNWAPVWE